MKSLKDTLYESIMDVDSVDNKVEASVEWKDRLKKEAQKLTKKITLDNAWAYDMALWSCVLPIFRTWNTKCTPDYNERFASFMECCMNPYLMDIYPDEFDPDEYSDIRDVDYSKRGSFGVEAWMDICKNMREPETYQTSMSSSGSIYLWFFPNELEYLYEPSLGKDVLVKRFRAALKKLIEITEL